MLKKTCLVIIFLLFGYVGLSQDFFQQVSACAIELTKDSVEYDPSYFSIKYPNGDVPEGKGVCTDVVIRSYRKMGIDLQKEVHEDMKQHFSVYPKLWGLIKTDTNIEASVIAPKIGRGRLVKTDATALIELKKSRPDARCKTFIGPKLHRGNRVGVSASPEAAGWQAPREKYI